MAQFLKDPLLGKTSLSRVFWLYGVVGSFLYSVIGLFIDLENTLLIKIYLIVGVIYTAYVIVAAHRCAGNTKSPLVARLARIASVISLVLLVLFTAAAVYLYARGMLSLSSLGVDL